MLYRIIYFSIFVAGGYLFGLRQGFPFEGVYWGAAIGLTALVIDYVNTKLGIGMLIGGVIGLSLGLLFAKLLYFPVKSALTGVEGDYISLALNSLFGYSGLFFGIRQGKNFDLSSIVNIFRGKVDGESPKIIDTSVIIDGRLADVCEAGFAEGIFIIPQFVLQELQNIADSSDPVRKARGRRGLDVVDRIQKMSNVTIKIVNEDFPKIREVDSKLVALARQLGAKIITNDINLCKIAQLQGVNALNLNELANALRPVVLPGENMNIFIVKEGKEHNQGVGYLDDGTMVVVDNARRIINNSVNVVVTSVLQTATGRMIFARLKEEMEKEELKAVRS
ncbi:MAG: PIN domain nuclease [Nitrospirae bacterium]|nr:PIN domain nuclease [Nitrospirota bacterium]